MPLRIREQRAGKIPLLAAGGLLGAWLVALAQGWITYARLMILAGRRPTVLETALLTCAGVCALLGGALRVASRRGTPRELPTRSGGEPSASTVCAGVLFIWYLVAVVQWWLVVDAHTIGGSMRRDPTPVEHLLLLAAVTFAGVALWQAHAARRSARTSTRTFV